MYDPREPYPLAAFRHAYRALARSGQADEVDSCEYRRVHREWDRAGRPEPTAYILRATNTPPPKEVE